MLNTIWIFAVITLLTICVYITYKAFVYTRPYKEIIEQLDNIEEPTEEERNLFWRYLYCSEELDNPLFPLLANFILITIAVIFLPRNDSLSFTLIYAEVFIVFPLSFIISIKFSENNIKTRDKYNICDPVADFADSANIAACLHGLYSVGKKFKGSSKRQLDYFKHHRI